MIIVYIEKFLFNVPLFVLLVILETRVEFSVAMYAVCILYW